MADRLKLPSPIRDALTEARARLVYEWEGPKGRLYQLWLSGRGARVMIELADYGVTAWQPVDDSNKMQATVDAMRAYLTAEMS